MAWSLANVQQRFGFIFVALLTEDQFQNRMEESRERVRNFLLMICQHCRAEISDGSHFCTYCGTPQDHFADTPCLVETPRFRLDLGKLLGDTFEIYKSHFGVMCLVGVILYGIPTAIGICGALLQGLSEAIAKAGAPQPLLLIAMLIGLSIFFSLLQNIAQYYLVLGALRQCLHLVRNGVDFRADMMFPPPMMFLKAFAVWLIVGLIPGGILLVSALPAGIMYLLALFADMFNVNFNINEPSVAMIAMIAVGVLFFTIGICVAIWVSVRFSLAVIFVADQNAGIIDSMRYSWQVTSGNFWWLFVAIIVLGICSMVGMVLCCIGIVLTIAVCWLGNVLAYLQLTGQPSYLDYPAQAYQQHIPVAENTANAEHSQSE